MADLDGKIEFKDVWFKYPTRDQWVLKGFNLVIEAGQQIALVGQSGCGKSTCIQLLQRFYDVNRGEIMIDGINIQKLNLKTYIQSISLVGQEPILFDRTIHQNIAYGVPEASRIEVTNAASDANALQFIQRDDIDIGEKGVYDMGKGFDRRVGTKGGQLSGGQKQRIAIARAILKKPKILLLDEATSALDRESQNVVQMALDRVMKNQTSVVVAHRISTIEGVDSIKVLKDGKLVEEGKYEELMGKQNGEFFTIATGDKSKV